MAPLRRDESLSWKVPMTSPILCPLKWSHWSRLWVEIRSDGWNEAVRFLAGCGSYFDVRLGSISQPVNVWCIIGGKDYYTLWSPVVIFCEMTSLVP